MSASTPSGQSSGVRQEWWLAAIVALTTVLVALGVWLYTSAADPVQQQRPRPVWLGVPKVVSQMSDGRVLEVKVNLQLKDSGAARRLSGHQAAFTTVIQEVGSTMTKDDVRGADSIERYGRTIRTSLNDYLEDRNMGDRVRHVAFEELTLVR